MADRQNPDRRAPENARESDETKKRPEPRNEQGICVDQRGQDQPADKERAQKNK